MKIAIDLRTLENDKQNRGIWRYLTKLLQYLSELDHTNEYIFVVSAPTTARNLGLELDRGFQYSFWETHEGWRNKHLALLALVRHKTLSVDLIGADVFLQLDMLYPVRSKQTPIIAVAHDLIPFIFPDMYQHLPLSAFPASPRGLLKYFRNDWFWFIARRSLRRYMRADHFLTISEHSAQDILRLFPAVKKHQITVTPLGVEPMAEAKGNSFAKTLPEQYLLNVGGVDPRKGLEQLVDDLVTLRKTFPNLQLVLAGSETTNLKIPAAQKLVAYIEAKGMADHVKRLGRVSDAELHELYEHAAAFVWSSRYEGFGLPVLEAMQAGSPVVTYRNSSIPEIAGDAALLVTDGTSLSTAIEKVLTDVTLRKNLIALGHERAKKFSWQTTAQKTLDAFMATTKK